MGCQTSSKFNENKRHVAEPDIKQIKHLIMRQNIKQLRTSVSDWYMWKRFMKTIDAANIFGQCITKDKPQKKSRT